MSDLVRYYISCIPWNPILWAMGKKLFFYGNNEKMENIAPNHLSLFLLLIKNYVSFTIIFQLCNPMDSDSNHVIQQSERDAPLAYITVIDVQSFICFIQACNTI